MKKLILTCTLSICSFLIYAQQYSVSGYVKDASNGETLIGATVLVKGTSQGIVTNVYGFYSLSLPADVYDIEIRYIGYNSVSSQVDLTQGDQRLDTELSSEETKLEEVVVSAKAANANVTDVEMSTVSFDIKTIKKIPSFMGEVDVIKSLQLAPGVSTVGEGASGFNVRGGSVGQNLILLDEAPVYNSSHLFGFFSVFNPDAVKDVKLYKGGIPAQFGGRVSSVLDVRMKEGNSKQYTVNGGIGTVFGRLSVEGPIIKDKASFIVAGRRSWIDVLARPADVLGKDDKLFFYDLTLKGNYNINDKNRVFVSGYVGRDIFEFDGASFSWGNQTGTVRWNHLFSDKLFMNVSAIFSEYDYALAFGNTAEDRFDWDSEIQTIDLKPEFSYYLNANNELNFGGQITYYQFQPANAIGAASGELIDLSVPFKYALETGIYINNDQKVLSNLTLSYGIRVSTFDFMGPGEAYTLDISDERLGRYPKDVTSTDEYKGWESIENHVTPEPRISFNYTINSSNSIKGSYNRMAQYIHLISVSTASNPLDLWAPSTNNIAPERANLYSLGYFKNLSNNRYELSAEVYYRTIDNVVDYRNGVSLNDLLITDNIEVNLLSGESRAYGLELYAKKNSGKFNGWISYTLSRAEIRTKGLNNDDWYLANYDQPHNFKVVAFYNLKERITLSANFSYNTGRPYTAMDQEYSVAGFQAYYSSNGDRNSKRVPDYHRLDVSATFNFKQKSLFGRPYRSDLVVGIYNVYGRRNPFSIYINPGETTFNPGSSSIEESTDPSYNQFSMLGTILPSISYNFNF